MPSVAVDRDLASAWFAWSLRPDGWEVPSPWDSVAGDYAGADGWIKLHTNAPHHRAAALAALGVPGERQAVADAVARWKVEDLEAAVVEAGGAAAAMRSMDEWDGPPPGRGGGPANRGCSTNRPPPAPTTRHRPGRSRPDHCRGSGCST